MDRSSRLDFAVLTLGNGALLLCALVGLALSFVTAYPVGVEPTALLPQAVIFALVSLAAWSLPRWSGRVCLGLAALWAFNVFLNRQSALRGAMLVFSRCLAFVAERLGYDPLFRYEPPAGVSKAEITAAFLTLALALIALLLGGAVVRLRCWWLAMLLTLPPLAPAMVTSALPHWAGFGALCVFWCAMLLTALCREEESRGRLTLAAIAACTLLLAGIGALFPAEGYARPQWAVDTERAIVDFGDRCLTFLRDWRGPFHRPDGPAAAPLDVSVSLSESGERNYTGRPVLLVRTAASGHYYLRGFSSDVYTGSGWEPFPDGVWEEYASALPEDGWTGSPLLFLGCASPYRTYFAVVENADRESASVFLPYQPVDQLWAEAHAWPVRDQGFVPAEGAWSFTTAITAYDRDLYALVYWPLTHDGALSPLAGPAAQAEEIYREYVYRHYLEVPDPAREAVSGLLAQLARDGAGPPSAAHAAELIPELLAERCAYDLDTPATPEGEDYVTWFLNESRQGYCMHFATAATLMFRALGFPARYVSGYTADLAANTVSYVPDSAAHAWVEVYIDGWGWYPVEVTPGFSDEFDPERITESGGQLPGAGLPTLPPEETEPPAPTPAPAPSESPGPAPAPAPEEPSPGGAAWRTALAVLGVLARVLAVPAAAAALLWLVQFCLKRRRLRRLNGPDPNRAVLFGYRCLSRMGPWGGKIPPEARALAEKAMYSAHALTGEEQRTMAALVDGQRHALWMRLYGWRRLTFLWLWGGPKQKDIL